MISKQARGDLTCRIKVKSKDEIGQLVDGVNNFIEQLQFLMQKIQNSSQNMQEMAASMEEISATLEQISHGSSEILERVQAMQNSVVAETGNVEQTACR